LKYTIAPLQLGGKLIGSLIVIGLERALAIERAASGAPK
jgi:hypothetical protein